MWIYVWRYTFSFLWEKYPGVQLLRHMRVIIWEPTRLFSCVIVWFTFPAESRMARSSAFSPALLLFLISILAILLSMWLQAHGGFNLHSLDGSYIDIFSCACLLETIYLSLLSSESVLKDTLTGYSIWVDNSFRICTSVCYFFLASMVSDAIFTVIWIISSL